MTARVFAHSLLVAATLMAGLSTGASAAFPRDAAINAPTTVPIRAETMEVADRFKFKQKCNRRGCKTKIVIRTNG